jgi:RNA-binding protein PNO1
VFLCLVSCSVVYKVLPSANFASEDEDIFDADQATLTSHDAVAAVLPANDGSTPMQIDEEGAPLFAPASESQSVVRVQTRKVPVPPHRFTPLKNNWSKLYPPLVNHLKLQVRMNVKNRAVELRTSKATTDSGALQKGEDFVKAFTLGFDLDDAIALLRLDDLFIETFEVKDVKTLQGDHMGRAIGRIAGKDGKTKFAIENASKTRIVLADSKIHILGGFQNIRIARESVVSLILGAPPGKVYHNLRTVSARMKERF